MTVARNKAIDRLRRAASAHRRTMAAAPELVAGHTDAHDPTDSGGELIIDDGLVGDEHLRSRGATQQTVRVDLADEALRLTRLVDTLAPGTAEIEGLIALELFHHSRIDSRVDNAGDLLLLDEQDRSRWNRTEIGQANETLTRAMARMRPGPYQVQAVIAGYHANARTAGDTDWLAIVGLYQQLSQMTASPVIALNHAVAVAMVDGPNAGLALIDRIDGLREYHLYHASRAELLLRAGDRKAAHTAFVRSLDLTDNPAEQRHLTRRLQICEPG